MNEQQSILRTILAMLLISLVFITYHQWHQNEQQAMADVNKSLKESQEEMEGEKEKLASVNAYLKDQSSENERKNGF